MKGGVTFFRSGSSDALRTYFFSPEATNSDYYLEDTAQGHAEQMTWSAEGGLSVGEIGADGYAAWVDFSDPETGESRGTVRKNSVRFVEKSINVDKSLSLAAVVSPRVEAALHGAQRRAAEAMTEYVIDHGRTRVGPAGGQRQVPVEHLEVVTHAHSVSRENEPHPHLHWQVGARVFAEGAWRQLDTADFARHSAALNAVGANAMRADPQLRRTLAAEGYTFDPSTGQVAELAPYVEAFSTRAGQIRRNKELFWANYAAMPEQVRRELHRGPLGPVGPAFHSAVDHIAWNGTMELEYVDEAMTQRPVKEPAQGDLKQRWRDELAAIGFRAPEHRTPDHGTPDVGTPGVVPDVVLGEAVVDRGRVAEGVLARLAGTRSAWSSADIQAEAAQAITASGFIGAPDELAVERAAVVTAVQAHCRSLADPRTVPPQTARHWTTQSIIDTEDELRTSFAARAAGVVDEQKLTDAMGRVKECDPQLSAEQARAAALLGAGSQLVVIEGAAGAGKTKQLAAAAAVRGDRPMVTVTPTLKAAQEARHAGADACSLHKLLHAHGFRWDENNQWTRLAAGEVDPVTGHQFLAPEPGDEFYMYRDTQIVVDEAGMVDQEAARALLRLADSHQAGVALMGDRAQLAAVGRGGVLDMAAQVTTEHVDLDQVHRFHDPEYARLSLQLRERSEIPETFDALYARGDVRIHTTAEHARSALAAEAAADIQTGRSVALTVPTNEAAKRLNQAVQAERVFTKALDPTTRTTTGSDGLDIYAGDTVMTRSNNRQLGVANRESFRVVDVHADGALTIAGEDHRHRRIDPGYVSEHVHLGYAVTDYGNQGTTVDHGAVLLEEGMSGGGAYVGATRGRETNTLHIIAEDQEHAREKFTQIMGTDRADRGLDQARRDFAEQTKNLVLHPRPPQLEGYQDWAKGLPEQINEAGKDVAEHRHAKNWPHQDAAFRTRHGDHPKDARNRHTQTQREVEKAKTQLTQARQQITAEQWPQITKPMDEQLDTLRAAEAKAREAGLFTRGSKTRQAHQLRAEVENQLGVRLPGDDRVADQPPAQQDIDALAKVADLRLSQIIEDHPGYHDAQRQLTEATTTEHQAQKTLETIRQAHRNEVGKQPHYDPQQHAAAEEWHAHMTNHGVYARQITDADPQQQVDLFRWYQTEHQPYMKRLEEQETAATEAAAAAAAPPRRVRSVEEQLNDAYGNTPGPNAPGANNPGQSGPDIGR